MNEDAMEEAAQTMTMQAGEPLTDPRSKMKKAQEPKKKAKQSTRSGDGSRGESGGGGGSGAPIVAPGK